jgi:quinol monooxygenase YgiN
MYIRVTRSQSDPANIDETTALVADIRAAIRDLPGCQGVQIAVDRLTGKSVAISTYDTPEHARFSRDTLGVPLARLVATGWQPDPPAIYEVAE